MIKLILKIKAWNNKRRYDKQLKQDLETAKHEIPTS